jgi:hypothetical protein
LLYFATSQHILYTLALFNSRLTGCFTKIDNTILKLVASIFFLIKENKSEPVFFAPFSFVRHLNILYPLFFTSFGFFQAFSIAFGII